MSDLFTKSCIKRIEQQNETIAKLVWAIDEMKGEIDYMNENMTRVLQQINEMRKQIIRYKKILRY